MGYCDASPVAYGDASFFIHVIQHVTGAPINLTQKNIPLLTFSFINLMFYMTQ